MTELDWFQRALAAFVAGDCERARALLDADWRSTPEEERSYWLADLVVDARGMLSAGDPTSRRSAIGLLTYVARIDSDDDLSTPAIDDARALLEELDEPTPPSAARRRRDAVAALPVPARLLKEVDLLLEQMAGTDASVRAERGREVRARLERAAQLSRLPKKYARLLELLASE